MSNFYRLLNEVKMFIFVVIVFLQIYHVVSLVDHNNQIEAKIPGDGAVNEIIPKKHYTKLNHYLNLR